MLHSITEPSKRAFPSSKTRIQAHLPPGRRNISRQVNPDERATGLEEESSHYLQAT